MFSLNRVWDENLLSTACQLLSDDLPLPPGSPGGMEPYRRTLTLSFFFKFYLTVLHRLQERQVRGLGWGVGEGLGVGKGKPV